MRTKHNKKRNTAFVFEALIREATKAIVSNDTQRKNKVISIIKEHFSNGSVLNRELKCYKALLETKELDKYTAEKMIFHARAEHDKISKSKIFEKQSQLIKDINKELGTSVFSNFVPNYKSFATVNQIFSLGTSLKKRVILEAEVLESLSSKTKLKESKLAPVDNLVVNSFVNKYNSKYKELLPEQRDLLNKYIVSLGDNYADFQLYLVEELTRIKNKVQESLKLPEVQTDAEMLTNTNIVLERVDSFDVTNISEKELKKVLKLQSLVREYESDDAED
jgi:tRNA-binding EMAP/Myf-like protein